MATMEKIETRDQLHFALYDAAELEHTICCQYLFAAFSLKCREDEGLNKLELDRVREWKSQLLLLARQEMVHLGVICNLLTVVGGAPHLERADFPMRATNYPDGMRFELLPFSLETLERFIQFEQPVAAGAPVPRRGPTASMPKARLPVKLREERRTGAVRVCSVDEGTSFTGAELHPGDEIMHIWDKAPLSPKLRAQVEQATPGTEVSISALSGQGQPKTAVTRLVPFFDGPSHSVVDYESVSQLYARIGEGLELLGGKKASSLLANLGNGQLSNKSLGWPEKEVVHDMNFPRIKDLATAKEALKFIQQQGEGMHGNGGHYGLLLNMRTELGKLLEESGRKFVPARPVLPNPRTREEAWGAQDGRLERPALDVAHMFNHANETMLMMLARLYADAGQEESRFAALRDTALRSIMTMVIRPIGEMLTEMPAHKGGALRAGATFEVGRRIPLIHDRSVAWTMFHERLQRLVQWSGELMAWPGVPARMKYVHENLTYLAKDLGEQLAPGGESCSR